MTDTAITGDGARSAGPQAPAAGSGAASRAAAPRRARVGGLGQNAPARAALSRDPVLRRQTRLDRRRDLHARSGGRDPRPRPHPARRRGRRRRRGAAAGRRARPAGPPAPARRARAALASARHSIASWSRRSTASSSGSPRRCGSSWGWPACPRWPRSTIRCCGRCANRRSRLRWPRSPTATGASWSISSSGSVARALDDRWRARSISSCSSSTRSTSRRRSKSCGADCRSSSGPSPARSRSRSRRSSRRSARRRPGALRKALGGDLELGAARRVGPLARSWSGREARRRSDGDPLRQRHHPSRLAWIAAGSGRARAPAGAGDRGRAHAGDPPPARSLSPAVLAAAAPARRSSVQRSRRRYRALARRRARGRARRALLPHRRAGRSSPARRVPGHQPRPVVGAAADRRGDPRLGRRLPHLLLRRRPQAGDLRVARRLRRPVRSDRGGPRARPREWRAVGRELPFVADRARCRESGVRAATRGPGAGGACGDGGAVERRVRRAPVADGDRRATSSWWSRRASRITSSGRPGDSRELAASMPEASIAVLVQTNDQAAAALDALRRLGVEASGEGTGAVADDPAVAAVIAALVLADHPGDTIAAFHVAGSPLADVVGLRSSERSHAIAVSRRLRRHLAERGAAVVLAEWRRALRGAAGARGRMRLAQAIDLAERFDLEGGGRPGRPRGLPVARRGREPQPGRRARDDDPSRQGSRVRRRGAARARSSVAAAAARAGLPAATLAAGAGRRRAPIGRGRRAPAGARSSRTATGRSWLAGCATI